MRKIAHGKALLIGRGEKCRLLVGVTSTYGVMIVKRQEL